jgi:hypothetical protein
MVDGARTTTHWRNQRTRSILVPKILSRMTSTKNKVIVSQHHLLTRQDRRPMVNLPKVDSP